MQDRERGGRYMGQRRMLSHLHILHLLSPLRLEALLLDPVGLLKLGMLGLLPLLLDVLAVGQLLLPHRINLRICRLCHHVLATTRSLQGFLQQAVTVCRNGNPG